MSNVIEVQADKRQEYDGRGEDDARRTSAASLAKIDLSGWRPAVTELRKLKELFRKYERELMTMPDSPEKGHITVELSNGHNEIQRMLAVCFARATTTPWLNGQTEQQHTKF